jgi:quercetin dioxygenase-like cupin family protein
MATAYSAGVRALQMAKFAGIASDEHLEIDRGPRPYQMANSDGTGEPLIAANGFGADVIRFAGEKGVQPHVHEGDHILFVLAGEGVLSYESERHHLYPGLCYFVPGDVVHAIDAKSDLVMIAVGNRHQPVDAESRMTPVSPDNG